MELTSCGIPLCQVFVKSYHSVLWDYYHAWQRLWVHCHCFVFQSIHQGFPRFRNEIIFIWQRDSNFKPSLVHCFPLHPSTTPGISLTRPVWKHLLCAHVGVIAHYGIKEWLCGCKIERKTISPNKTVLRLWDGKASVSGVRQMQLHGHCFSHWKEPNTLKAQNLYSGSPTVLILLSPQKKQLSID